MFVCSSDAPSLPCYSIPLPISALLPARFPATLLRSKHRGGRGGGGLVRTQLQLAESGSPDPREEQKGLSLTLKRTPARIQPGSRHLSATWSQYCSNIHPSTPRRERILQDALGRVPVLGTGRCPRWEKGNSLERKRRSFCYRNSKDVWVRMGAQNTSVSVP